MEKLDKHIEELLHKHDCVIVPEFGGFITSRMPAFYNKYTSVFHPAKKKILFNKYLVYNDGLLATQVAKKKEMSIEEANQMLIQFKDDCFLRLNKEGRVEIERVGVLFFDKEKNIQFQQSDINFLQDSFGLSTVSLEKLKKAPVKPATVFETITRHEDKKVDRKSIAVVKPSKEERKKRRGAILLPLLIFPFALGGLFIGNQQGYIGESKLNVSSFNPFYSSSIEVYHPRTETVVFDHTEDLKEEKLLDKKDLIVRGKENSTDEEAVVIITEKVDSTYNEVKEIPLELKYHVIIGCFSVKENAENLVDSWIKNGNDSKIIDKNGRLYRVAVQSFVSKREAKSFLSEMKNDYKGSLWVLKK